MLPSVSSAGDVDGDGYDDIIISASPGYSSGYVSQTYVLFGFDYDNDDAQSVTHIGTDNNDIISGKSVNDNLSGGKGNDIIHGRNGDDTIDGGLGNDRLDAGSGNDKITGGNGNDIINAGNGDDTIDGGNGDDSLSGNAGKDTFIFNNGYGKDIIFDFEDGIDKLDFSSYTKDDGAGGAVAITFADLTITRSGGDIKIDGLDAGDEVLIRNEPMSNITADDFIFG